MEVCVLVFRRLLLDLAILLLRQSEKPALNQQKPIRPEAVFLSSVPSVSSVFILPFSGSWRLEAGSLFSHAL